MTNNQCFCCKKFFKVGDFYTITTAFTLDDDEIKYFRHKDYICDSCWYEKEKIKKFQKGVDKPQPL